MFDQHFPDFILHYVSQLHFQTVNLNRFENLLAQSKNRKKADMFDQNFPDFVLH